LLHLRYKQVVVAIVRVHDNRLLHRRRIGVTVSIVTGIVARIKTRVVGEEGRSQEKAAAEEEWRACESEATMEPKVIVKMVMKMIKPERTIYKDMVAGYNSPR
jgi:hypothetical protein